MHDQRSAIRMIAMSVTAGEFDHSIAERVSTLFDGECPKWLPPMVLRLASHFGFGQRHTRAEVARWIRNDKGFVTAWKKGRVRIRTVLPIEDVMLPAWGAPGDWQAPPARTLPELADLLQLEMDGLGWLTARKDYGHYTCRWLIKPNGAGARLIEIPKPVLMHAQRQVLHRILSTIPVHESVHGFCRGKSVRTFVAPHTGRELVLKLDLESFFHTVRASRVQRIFMTAGYPETVAQLLTRLCTRATPEATIHLMPGTRPDFPLRQRLRTPHLPQGAPSSPALANLAAFRLDCRMSGLATSFGAQYTRYADDLLFSGEDRFSRSATLFYSIANVIILEEGFRTAFRKTRFMGRGGQQKAAGVVVNTHPNLDRREFDRLKAILTNCVRHGLESQSRDRHPDFLAHLQGRVSWVRSLNPERARKLEALLELIQR